MKYFLAFACSLLFSFSVSAQNVGSTTSGPIVKCESNNGVVEHVPIVICKHSNGKVHY